MVILIVNMETESFLSYKLTLELLTIIIGIAIRDGNRFTDQLYKVSSVTIP